MRACERSIVRLNSKSRTNILSVRRNDTEDYNNGHTQNSDINIEEYKTEQGFYSIPNNIWNMMDVAGQENVKDRNRKLRKERKPNRYRKNYNGTGNNDKRNFTQRRNNSTPCEGQDDGDKPPTAKDLEPSNLKIAMTMQHLNKPLKMIVTNPYRILPLMVLIIVGKSYH